MRKNGRLKSSLSLVFLKVIDMNKRAKGHKAENEARDLFESRGYRVQVAQRTTVFTGKFYVSKDNDYFNLFDLIAINEPHIIFIQVKTNVSHCYSAMKEINKFKIEVGNPNIVYQVRLRVPRKGWVVWVTTTKDKDWVKTFENLKGIAVMPFKYS